ncbi:hypothetical protein QUC31_005744 [Theobroma cacao]|uniref:KIB1-4 beta-propeller domain-containing protein n=1 Tax=Theobroma cacao TaxID=3641 RepID=A0A061FT18_THECC|nr:Uncharacterized protein TCM_045609 [Theobroma cacao]
MSLVKEQVADWGNIVGDILRCIADKTYSFQDRVRMGVVCRSWQASLKNEKINFHIFLMLAEKKNSDRRCFNIGATETILELELPEIRGKRCWGTPFGWLVTYGLDLEIGLFNPLSRASISLPSQRTLDYDITHHTPQQLRLYFIHKVLLSSSPTSSDCIVMIIYGRVVDGEMDSLAFAKPGDQAWTQIPFTSLLDDVNYFNGNFFAVSSMGQLFLFEDLNGPAPKVVEFAAPPPIDEPHDKKYIVDLGGHLCMMSRLQFPNEVSYDSGKVEQVNLTEDFDIFKLDMHTKNWERILSLGDHSLFLGNCSTFSVLAADHPGCKPNCIYFTDDNPYYYTRVSVSDIGIYNCDIREDVDYIDDDEVPDLLNSFSPPLWIKLF